jgi:hypothetical protein
LNTLYLRRKWEANQVQDPTIVPFKESVRGDVAHSDRDASNPDYMDKLMLSTKPSERATHYTQMKAFGTTSRLETIPQPECRPMIVEWH